MNNRETLRFHLHEAGVPELQLRHVFDAVPKETDALRVVRDWYQGQKTFLFLSGTMGTGKSAAAAWACCQQRAGVAFVSADELRFAFSFGDEAQRVMKRLRNVPFLVIDDLGTEFSDAKGWMTQGVNALLNHRYGELLRTLVTTNFDVAEFKKQYPRITDRLRESGSFVVVGGESMRKKADV